jgi:hypothetical protein
VGLRYDSENISLGASFVLFPYTHQLQLSYNISIMIKDGIPSVIRSQFNGFVYSNSSC